MPDPSEVPENSSGDPMGGELAHPSGFPTGRDTTTPLKPEILSQAETGKAKGQLIISASYYEGVLPSPEYFEALERIVPGGAKQILESYLKQATHRQSNENKVIAANIEARDLGMKLGAWLASLGIIGGCAVAASGYPTAGVSIAGATAIALATSYLKALADHTKDLTVKKGIMERLTGRPPAKTSPVDGKAPPPAA